VNRNADRQVTLAGLTTAAGLLGLAFASTALPDATRRGLWLPIHLGLAGAGGTAVASVLPFFTTALAVARPARPAIRIAAITLVAVGALTVSTGVVTGSSAVSVAGGLLYLAGLVALAAAAFGTLGASLGVRRRLLWIAYGAAITQVLVGVAIATAMLGGYLPVVERWDLLKPAHAWLNVFGFLSLTIAATLIHLAPTAVGNRIRPRRSATLAVTGLIVGAPLIAVGLATGSDLAARAGALIELVGAVALVGHGIAVQRDHGRWTTDPAWHRLTSWSLIAAPIWFLVATIVAGGRIILMGADPAAWSLPAVAAPLAIGWVAQVLIGAWNHLLPAIGPGDARAHARQRLVLGRGATARSAALNLGVALLMLGDILPWAPASAAGVGLSGASGIAALATFLAAVWQGRSLRSSPGPKPEGA
jgi:nitrite reductase (NO-forming)